MNVRISAADLAEFVARGNNATAAVEAILASARAPGRRQRRGEDALQRALVRYWEYRYPESWAMTFHVPNGLGARNPKLAAIFKGLGMKAGVLDLICIARRGPYSGFALELKDVRGAVSAAQDSWLEAFRSEGWYASIAFDIDAALAAVDRYHAFGARIP